MPLLWLLLHVLLRSQGMFLFVSLVLNDLQEHQPRVDALAALPHGLNEYLEESLDRSIKLHQFQWEDMKPAFQVLLAAFHPCSLNQVFNVARMLRGQLDGAKFDKMFNAIKPFLGSQGMRLCACV